MEKLQYKGYFTEIHFSEEDQLLYGKIEGIADLINFESESAKEIVQEFHNAVDDYLEFCLEQGKEPDKPFKGSFNVRISPTLHKAAYLKAMEEGVSLNALVEKSVSSYVKQGGVALHSMTVNLYQYPKGARFNTSSIDTNAFSPMITAPLVSDDYN